jgi:hypothetical protein
VIDSRFLERWQRERAARERVRGSLPVSWRADPRPEMAEVCEIYVEAMLQMGRRDGDAVPNPQTRLSGRRSTSEIA